MPPPVLPDQRFPNPFTRDASGRNVFERAAEIAIDTITGAGRDVRAGARVATGQPAGEGGAVTEGVQGAITGQLVSWLPPVDIKSIVVYGIAIVLVIVGLRGTFK